VKPGIGRTRHFLGPKPIKKDDYPKIRAVLKALADARTYFYYCPQDRTFIWHGPGVPWTKDDDGRAFLQMASGLYGQQIGELTVQYFRDHCVSSHIDLALKDRRLNSQSL
jgi:hypothetical protein